MRTALVLLTIAASLSALACGDSATSSGSDEDQITAVIESYEEAINDGDGEAACELITEEAQSAAASDGGTCEGAVTLASAFYGDDLDFEIGEIVVTGDTATASVTSEYGTEDMQLERVDDQWLIASDLAE